MTQDMRFRNSYEFYPGEIVVLTKTTVGGKIIFDSVYGKVVKDYSSIIAGRIFGGILEMR